MVSNRSKIVYLLILILFLSAFAAFVADWARVIRLSDYVPYLKKERPALTQKDEPEDELRRVELTKWEDRLRQKEEELASRELELRKSSEELDSRQEELAELQTSLEEEKIKIATLKKDYGDQKKKIEDMAGKIANMPPASSVKILLTWPDYDIIAVLRQMDKNAEELGQQSIVPFLLTQIDEAEPGRGGSLTKKMLTNPKLTAEYP